MSSNELPYPPLPGVLARAQQECERAHRYPDMLAVELRHAIAAHHGVTADQVAVGTGSSGVLYALLQAFAGNDGQPVPNPGPDPVPNPGLDEVVYAWRSFEAYPIAVAVTGARPVPVALTGTQHPDGPGRHHLTAMAAALTDRTKVVLVCSPNNPTGTVVHADELAAFLRGVNPQTLVVVDEAYQDFVTDPRAAQAVPLLSQHPNLVVLRTFSKAHGLAGLRVGYALAHPSVCRAITTCSVPFGVSGVAQSAALASLSVTDDLAQRVSNVIAERQRIVPLVRTLVEAHSNLAVPDTHANFFWIDVADGLQWSPVALAEQFSTAGIAVRPFPEGVRISLGTPVENDRMLACATDIFRRA